MSAFNPEHGFLLERDPIQQLPPAFAPWEELGRALPKLLIANQARRMLDDLPVISAEALDASQLERAMSLLSFLGHAAIWEDWRTVQGQRVPRGVAVPWTQVAARLGRPPALAYASHVLHNWRRYDATAPVAIGNLASLQNFYGGLDEDWFIHVHIEIEAKAIPAVGAVQRARIAADAGDTTELLAALRDLGQAQANIDATLARMNENCEPFIFFQRIQPFFHGFKDVLFEGVGTDEGERRTSLGGSAAQSAFLPLADAVLGIAHADDALISYLLELRAYMPTPHRAFLEEIERGCAVRRVVAASGDERLVAAYNESIDWVRRFREAHLEIAAAYIQRQAKKREGEIGTGGTPFMRYLKKHLDETVAHQLR